MYRQILPGQDLSIEQGTPNVPNDGFYYVLHAGETSGRFRSLAQATKHYLKIKETLNISLPPVPERLSMDQMMQRDLDSKSNKALFWSEDDFTRVDRKTRGRPKH